MKPELKEVYYATLHNSIFIPGNVVGQIGPVLTADPNGGKQKTVKMSISESGLFLLVEIRDYTIAVPMTNVTHCMLKAEKVG